MLYRPCVAAIVQNRRNQILICERSDKAGYWQFPQGGRQQWESLEEALERELEEEVSLKPAHYKMIRQNGPYRYVFPKNYTKNGYHGQEQVYFLLQLVASESCVNVKTATQEFSQAMWITPSELKLAWVPPVKRVVYQQVMVDFFSVQIC